jgi:hypothetical protein
LTQITGTIAASSATGDATATTSGSTGGAGGNGYASTTTSGLASSSTGGSGSSASSSSSSSKTLSGETIGGLVGGVLGGIALLAALAFLIFSCGKRRGMRNGDARQYSGPETAAEVKKIVPPLANGPVYLQKYDSYGAGGATTLVGVTGYNTATQNQRFVEAPSTYPRAELGASR